MAVSRACDNGDGRNGSADGRGAARGGGRDLREREAIKAEIADFVAGVLDAQPKRGGMRLPVRRSGDVRNRVRERRLLAPQEAKHKQCVDK